MKELKLKYEEDLSALGASLENAFEHENDLVESLILEYYTTFDVSEEFIEELKFILMNVGELTLQNKIMCSYFTEKYITGRFDEYGFKYEKFTFLS